VGRLAGVLEESVKISNSATDATG